MAQDVGLDFAAGPTVTLISADVTDTNVSALTSSVDFGSPGPVAFGFHVILTVGASGVDFCYVEVAWSQDDTTFADLENLEIIASVDCQASVDVEAVGVVPLKGRYAKFRLRNESGGTIDGTASNTELKLFDVFYNQV